MRDIRRGKRDGGGDVETSRFGEEVVRIDSASVLRHGGRS
jgi:hypothetical protein